MLYLTVDFVSPKVFVGIKSKDIYAVAMIKKRRYWPKGVPGEPIDTHFEDKEVGDVGMIETTTEDNNPFRKFV